MTVFSYFFFVFLVYVMFCFLVLDVSTSAVDCLERLVSEMTCYVSSGPLNPTHSLKVTQLRYVDIGYKGQVTYITCSFDPSWNAWHWVQYVVINR